MTRAELAYKENVDETNRERDELILQQLASGALHRPAHF